MYRDRATRMKGANLVYTIKHQSQYIPVKNFRQLQQSFECLTLEHFDYDTRLFQELFSGEEKLIFRQRSRLYSQDLDWQPSAIGRSVGYKVTGQNNIFCLIPFCLNISQVFSISDSLDGWINICTQNNPLYL